MMAGIGVKNLRLTNEHTSGSWPSLAPANAYLEKNEIIVLVSSEKKVTGEQKINHK